MNLSELKIGETCRIKVVGGDGALRQHFLDMGLIPGAEATLVKFAPMGDPMELLIHGYEFTLRLEDARHIEIEKCEPSEQNVIERKKRIPHPGLGEGGRFHDKKKEHPLPDTKLLSFALVGNQNCGKTTLFNRLTGSNQHVGNFPGVTVDRKDGVIKGYKNTLITDLPGIYSMSPYSSEELVTREFILKEKPEGIINIVDASNMERNLYLTMQLLELNIPMVVALNMMDEVRENGGAVYINEMEQLLGIPVIPISAAKNEGINELIEHAIHVTKYAEKPERKDFCEDREPVHRCLHAIMHLIEDHAKEKSIPVRFAASKVVEGDEKIIHSLELDNNEKEMMEHIVLQMEKECGLDRAAAMADMRFKFIKKVCDETVVKSKESIAHARSRKIDKILTGKFTAIPSFILIMGLVFFLTFNVIGAKLQDLMSMGIDALTNAVSNAMNSASVNTVLQSLIVDGICKGVGSVLSFIPVILVLFMFLSLLEDSGYMARVAFVMDKLLRRIGLSGRSIVPMLIGFGCTVPGVMASRTLSSERDRKMTILLTPFMSCSAKLPIYAFLASAFFKEKAALVMVLMYFGGILVGILTAHILKGTLFKGNPVPFVMELPNYRMPGIKNVLQLLWEKTKDFLQRAFTVIFIASMVIWMLQTFDFYFNVVSNPEDSMLAGIAGVISPVFAPLGFGNWRISTALLTGFLAKESVVSTLSVLLPSGMVITDIISVTGALPLMVFCLLYTPCIAAIAAIRRELGRKWAVMVVVMQCVIAWIAAFIVRLIMLI